MPINLFQFLDIWRINHRKVHRFQGDSWVSQSRKRTVLCCFVSLVLLPTPSFLASVSLLGFWPHTNWVTQWGLLFTIFHRSFYGICTCLSSFLCGSWSSVYCCRDSVCTSSWYLLHSLHFLSSYEYQATEQVLCSLLDLRDMQKLCFTFIKLISGSLR